ncbi:acyl-CoA dehydrogenase family protein [Nocardia sp. CS682]|uniref:acyl-CoA dehydrogenase family protein n=1 Tax=Nocardia sp. CS682 TaxID=1047172 RepID=UPI001074D511|nr:acyl-CoA dehydrogenase family protein [Nocardia sp. CS682]QBS39182.1 acyl-CoA dehydrogenase [Nocardia sp. CS682]
MPVQAASGVGAWSRAEIAAFVDKVVAPRAAEFDQAARIDPSIIPEFAARGLWGAVLSETDGGTGAGMTTLAEVHEEVGRGCSSMRSLLTVHSMALYALDRWGTDTAKQRWKADLVAGNALGAFCLTEPEAGSDFAALQASARRTDDGWVLDGHKLWVTGGQLADVLLVFARTAVGPAAFLVEAANPGISRIPVRDITGTRGSQVAEIVFDNCEVGADALIGPEGMGLAIATGVLDIGRFSVAAGCVGILQACLNACVSYANSRHQGGALLREHQLVQQMIATIATNTRAARLLVWQAARLKDTGSPDTIMATCIAKQFAATAAAAAANDAVQLHGARGCTDEYPVGRYLRDAKVMEIIEGSTQLQHILIAADACRNQARVIPID